MPDQMESACVIHSRMNCIRRSGFVSLLFPLRAHSVLVVFTRSGIRGLTGYDKNYSGPKGYITGDLANYNFMPIASPPWSDFWT